jgi:hypothetical protein
VPSVGKIGICPSCNSEFWKEEAKVDTDRGEIEEDLPDCKDTDDIRWHFEDDGKEREIAYYNGLLGHGFANTVKKEFYIRVGIRWAINDLVRYMPSYRHARNPGMLIDIHRKRREARNLFEGFEKLRIENLRQLIYLYIKSGEVDYIVLAEMYRETGKFLKAQEVLEYTQEPENTYRHLKRLIRRKKSRIYRF